VDASLITADRASTVSPKAVERKSEKIDAENPNARKRIFVDLLFEKVALKGG
jgi:hypothetical protein